MILDLFAGPRGWSEGIKALGVKDIGLELEMNACRTAVAAGHTTVRTDVAAYPTSAFGNKVTGLIASPPCQDWSLAGKKAGLTGARGQLIMEVPRWVEGVNPEWIALEQVTTCLPFWRVYAEEFRKMGYRTWTGILNAADYGVPQVRKRAILMASRRSFEAPVPTHAKFPDDDLFGDERLPWITMATALGWEGVHTVLDSRGDGSDGGLHHRSDRFTTDRPARTLGEKARSWLVTPPPPDCPAWPYERPATTVVGSFRPDIMAAPGWRVDPKVPRRKAPDSVQITVQQAGILQSFPHDYPWSGARTRQFEQVGNAIPPLLARAIVKELL